MFLRAIGRPLLATVKQRTGSVGLDAVANAREVLIGLYSKTLKEIQTVPEDEGYRKAVESLTKHRLKVCQEEEDWEAIEKRLGCGQFGELMEHACDALTRIRKMILVANAREVLIGLYSKTLKEIQTLPEDDGYRKAVESLYKGRLKACQEEEDLEAIEKRFDCGLEELITNARDKLTSNRKIVVPNAREVLIGLYSKTIKVIQKKPDYHSFWKGLENRYNHQLKVCHEEEDLGAIEKRLGCGQVELIRDARNALAKIQEWNVRVSLREELIVLYSKTLEEIQTLPENDGYRKAVESFNKHRLKVCQEEEDFEKRLGCGQFELFSDARRALTLIRKMIESYLWGVRYDYECEVIENDAPVPKHTPLHDEKL